MFGYVTTYKLELKVKDYYKYRAYYCGLCRTLKERYGRIGQITLTYDMTFLVILLTSLYESDTVKEEHRCVVHPIKKRDMLCNEITEYAADMNIVLTYYHLVDDFKDEKSVVGFAGSKLLEKKYKKIASKYERQCSVIKEALDELAICEKDNNTDIDTVAGCFGKLMAELLVYKKDHWEESLRKIGFYLGKYIYIIDAYEDLEDDIKKNCFNPLKSIYNEEAYEEKCKDILTMMVAECAGEFEKLPCVVDVEILRNILYVGIFTKFDALQNERQLRKEQNNDKKSV